MSIRVATESSLAELKNIHDEIDYYTPKSSLFGNCYLFCTRNETGVVLVVDVADFGRLGLFSHQFLKSSKVKISRN